MIKLAGGIASGKSSAAHLLSSRPEVQIVRVREALVSVTGVDLSDRLMMQDRAAHIDVATSGRWLGDYIADKFDLRQSLVIDSVRTRLQAEALEEEFEDSVLVFLEASARTRRLRFKSGQATDMMKAATTFDVAMRHRTETEALELIDMADVVVRSDLLSAQDVADRVSVYL